MSEAQHDILLFTFSWISLSMGGQRSTCFSSYVKLLILFCTNSTFLNVPCSEFDIVLIAMSRTATDNECAVLSLSPTVVMVMCHITHFKQLPLLTNCMPVDMPIRTMTSEAIWIINHHACSWEGHIRNVTAAAFCFMTLSNFLRRIKWKMTLSS